MKLMVTGSRGWRDEATVHDVLDRLLSRADERGDEFELTHGGAAGADRLAWEWAVSTQTPQSVFAPDYRRPSPARYHERNDAMLDDADYVVAFWDGESTGTKSVIDKAEARGIPYEIVRPARPSLFEGALPESPKDSAGAVSREGET